MSRSSSASSASSPASWWPSCWPGSCGRTGGDTPVRHDHRSRAMGDVRRVRTRPGGNHHGPRRAAARPRGRRPVHGLRDAAPAGCERSAERVPRNRAARRWYRQAAGSGGISSMTTQEAAPATGQAVAEWAPSRDVALREWNADYRKLICNTVLKPDKREATAMELALFAEVAERSGLSPFMRQIFGVYRYDRRAGGEVMTIQVSIDGLRLIAERSGRYQGQTEPQWCGWDGIWCDVWLPAEPPAAARCGGH